MIAPGCRMPVRSHGFVSHRAIVALSLCALAGLTTAWSMFERGLFQDDAQTMFRVFLVDGVLQQSWHAIGTPTRKLQGIPYALALASSDALSVIRVCNESLPLAIALLSAALLRYGLHRSRVVAFLAGALTITATSDWLTSSPVAMGYHLAIACHLAGVVGMTLWIGRGRRGWLMLGLLGGAASLWTQDAAATVHPVTPVLFYLASQGPAARRRAAWAAALWWAIAVPYYATFLPFLADDAGYAGVALVSSTWAARALRTWDLVSYNFTPWVWALGRPQWFARPPGEPSTAGLWFAVAGLAVTGLAAWRLRAAADRSPVRPDIAAHGRLAAVFAVFTVLANATFMAVHLAEFHYRTQLLSRVWTSVALALLAGAIARRGITGMALAATTVAAFVGFGIAGGHERQDYFRGYWRRHQGELASIAAALPAHPTAYLVLRRREPATYYTASEAPYLARAWATLLDEDRATECRVFLAAAERGTTCSPDPDALVCRGDRSARCGPDLTAAHRIPYGALIVATYDPESARYVVDADLPPSFAPSAGPGADARHAYRPGALVRGDRLGRLAGNLVGAGVRR